MHAHICTHISIHKYMGTHMHTCIVNKIQHITNIHTCTHFTTQTWIHTHTSIDSTHIANMWNANCIMIAIIFVTVSYMLINYFTGENQSHQKSQKCKLEI